MIRFKRIIRIIIPMVVICMLVMWISIPTQASNHYVNIGDKNIKCDKDYDTYYISGSSSSNNITVDGKNITIYLENVNINLSSNGYKDKPAINIKDDSTVTIYLVGSNYLKGGKHTGVGKNYGKAGIHVSSDASVTILGHGSLTAIGGGGDRGAAGIGGNADDDAGKITIGNSQYSPVITATGATEAAGIGGGKDTYVKEIIINAGTIVATGGKYGAGIGGGNAVGLGNGGDVGTIKIIGGNITATGGEGGAGIGGGDESSVGSLRIEESKSGSLTIKATGGKWGAGIGSAQADISSIYIKLNNGSITATGGEGGAGIGGGNGTPDKIEIYGAGTINATGYRHSAGIGAGECENGGIIIILGNSGGYSLNITASAKATATSGSNDAAAIGSGDADCGDITIKNAKLTIYSTHFGAGIGTGRMSDFTRAGGGGNIVIDNCYITDSYGTSRDGAGIGAGWDGSIKNITIKNSTYTGGNIGGSNCTNDLYNTNTIESIYISNSTITAENRDGNRAAIGTGPFGAINSINIIDSNITAHSTGGAGIGTGGYPDAKPFSWNGGACGSIYISGSTIDAKGGDGGAGIGGGWGTSVGTIEIINCPSVTAIAGYRGQNDKYGGAGIGGGAQEGCGDITIENSNLTRVVGREHSAGIGSGGTDGSAATLWNITCGSIDISGSTVNVEGGEYGAGIGTGEGGQFIGSAYITISDSTVNAVGGEGGAGIGAGADGEAGRGGEASIDITIKGKSKVVANGGTRGAGIGGGCDGGAKAVYIDLHETTYKNGEWLYYVKAYGGAGAAGIGSGGVVEPDKVVINDRGQDIEKVSISGGYVYAKGGDDSDCRGSGAGIGGGARGGNIKGFYVSGGYVEAHAGYSQYKLNAKADIGTGGNDINNGEDKNFVITGGTVIGSLSSDPKTITVDGGSVSHRMTNAVNSEGKKVYQTTLELEEGIYTKLTNMTTSYKGYGTDDILSDGSKRVYLYLPESQKDAAVADFKLNSYSQHYYGTTITDGQGWLKKKFELSLNGWEEAVFGAEFQRYINVTAINGTVTYTVKGSASLVDSSGNYVDTITQDIHQNKVKLYGNALGDYTLTAKSDVSGNVYWNAEASMTETIKKTLGIVEVIEDISKVFDGTPVDNPGINTNSDGNVKYDYYKYKNADYAELINGVPTDAGKYAVRAYIPGTDKYSVAISEGVNFTISKRPVTLSMTAKDKNAGATVIIKVSGLVDSCTRLGKIQLDYVDYDGNSVTVTVPVIKNTDGTFSATAEFPTVVSGEHLITATYINYDNNNYICNPLTQSFDKLKAYRDIVFTDIGTKYYGDNEFILPVAAENGTGSAYDVWSYEIIDYYADMPEAVTIGADGTIKIQNAGIAVIKVMLTDSHDAYAPAVGYTTLTVKPKEVTVTSYVYQKGDDSKTPVTEAEYGTLTDLEYGLLYESVNEKDKENYSKSIVTLGAVPLPESTSVGIYSIGINKVTKASAAGTTDPFMSRNYRITYSYSDFEVTKSELIIYADDITVQYGMEPEYTYSYEGLMDWDTIDTVFNETTAPNVSIDTTVTDGKEYDALKPGVYKDALLVSGVSEIDNYTLLYADSGTLNITKGEFEIALVVRSKSYDGTMAEVNPQITTTGTGEEYDGNLIYAYYEFTSDGIVELADAPVNAGMYAVVVNAEETEYYNGNLIRKMYRITKATPEVDIPELSDMLMQDGLKLSDQKLPDGWTWLEPDTELSLGNVSALAVYTPEDTNNYNTVTKYLSFDVYEITPDDSNPPAGNFTPIIIALMLLLASGAAMAITIKK